MTPHRDQTGVKGDVSGKGNKKRQERSTTAAPALCWADHLDLIGNLRADVTLEEERHSQLSARARSMMAINCNLSALSPRRPVTHKAIPAIGEPRTAVELSH